MRTLTIQEQREAQGRRAMQAGSEANGDSGITDAITNLLHYADSLGLDPIALSRMAEMHFIDEREGGEG